MMQKYLNSLVLLLCLCGLTGCVNLKPTSSAMESFTIGPVEQLGPAEDLAQGDPIYILRPHIPTYLDGSQMSYRSATGEVINMPGTRWAEPLAEGIARAMALYLSASEQFLVEGYYPWPTTSRAARLSLNFQQFGAMESGEIHVVVHWTMKPSAGASQSGRFVAQGLRWQSGEPETLVAAYNQALQDLVLELEKNLN